MAKNTVPEPRFIAPIDPLEARLQGYLEGTFQTEKSKINPEWLGKIASRKTRIAEAFGVPDCETSVLIQTPGQPADDTLRTLYTLMARTEALLDKQKHLVPEGVPDAAQANAKLRYVGYVDVCAPNWEVSFRPVTSIARANISGHIVLQHNPDEDAMIRVHGFDYTCFGYSVGKKQVRWVKQLRKLDATNQKNMYYILATNMLDGVLNELLPPLDSDRNINWPLVLSKLGDALVAEGYAYLISFDPVLLLRQADNVAGNSSCHRPFGQYHMGPWVYLHDPWTFTVLAFDRKHLARAGTPEGLDHLLFSSRAAVGRCLYMLPDPGKPALVQSRFYGRGVTDETLAPVRAWLQTSLRKQLGLAPEPWSLYSTDRVKGEQWRPSKCYVDLEYFKGYALGDAPRSPWIGPWSPAADAARCPYCGRGLDSEKRFDCSCMAWATCEDCGCYLYGDDFEGDGDNYYCEDCGPGNTPRCDRCGDRCDFDELRNVDGDYWCEDCAGNYASWCDRCEEYTTQDMHSVDVGRRYSETWCYSCANDYATVCEDCGTLVGYHVSSAPNGDSYCADCFGNNVGCCENCGNTYMVEDLDADGHCEACAEELCGDEEEEEEEEEDIKI